MYAYFCSPLSPDEGLDKEVLFDLEQAGLQNIESNNSPSPIIGRKYRVVRICNTYVYYVCT